MMDKKGMEMWWIIIGAVLAMVVLVFFIYMFTSQGGRAIQVIEGCSEKGGQCFSSMCGTGDASDNPNVLGVGCEKDGEYKQTNYCCTTS